MARPNAKNDRTQNFRHPPSGGARTKPAPAKPTPAKPAARAPAAKPAIAKSAARKSAVGKPTIAKSAARKSAVGKPTIAKSAARKSASAKPAVAKPAIGKSAARKPAVAKPAIGKSAAAKQVAVSGEKTGAGRKTGATASKRKSKLDAPEAVLQAPAAEVSEEDRRNFGLRGAAPWVARHAAKHADELRRRNAEPPPPGSARATLRTPQEAEQIKGRIVRLYQLTGRINLLRKKLEKNFMEIGSLLATVQLEGLYEAKGFSTFETFVDREIELPRGTALKLIRIVHTFDREAALDYPLDRLLGALAALDGEFTQGAASHAQASSRSFAGLAMPPKAPIRWD